MQGERIGDKLLTCFTTDLQNYHSLAQKTLRPELHEVLGQSRSVQRFERLGLPKETIAGETVYVHVLRLACRVESLPIDDEKKGTCLVTVLIHDLPETQLLVGSGQTSDTTATEKAISSELDQAVESDEDKVAKAILTDEEFSLYRDFSQASDYLKGRSDITPSGIGLVCKILDKIDADLFFHRATINGLDNLEELSSKGQSLAFDQYTTFSKRLNMLKGTEISEYASLCQTLLDECMLTIREMWGSVPESKTPEIIRTCIQEMQIR